MAGETQAEINALMRLGDIAFDVDDDVEAQLLAETALIRSTAAGWAPGLANARRVQGQVAMASGDYTSARTHLAASLASARELGHAVGTTKALVCIGQLAIEMGELQEARQHLIEALEIAQALRHPAYTARGLEVSAALLIASADFGPAVHLVGAAAALREASRAPIAPRDQTWLEKQLAKARSVLGAASVEQALREGATLSLDRAIACVLELPNRVPSVPRPEARYARGPGRS